MKDLPVVQRDLMAQIFSWREGARDMLRAYEVAKVLARWRRFCRGVW